MCVCGSFINSRKWSALLWVTEKSIQGEEIDVFFLSICLSFITFRQLNMCELTEQLQTRNVLQFSCYFIYSWSMPYRSSMFRQHVELKLSLHTKLRFFYFIFLEIIIFVVALPCKISIKTSSFSRNLTFLEKWNLKMWLTKVKFSSHHKK